MKSIYGCLSILLFISTSLFSQDFVIEDDGLNDSLKKTIAIIPFQNNYYRSEIDRSLAASENIDYQSLRDAQRKELDKQLYLILSNEYEVYSFLKDKSQDDQELLDYIFYSTASSYTNIESDEKVDRSILSLGQINEAPMNEDQRYMKTVIHHPPLMATLAEQLPADLYLFIGELDILLPQNTEEKDKNRYIYMHFTLYNNAGEIVDSGMISQVISQKNCKRIRDISNDGFAPIAYQLKNRLDSL